MNKYIQDLEEACAKNAVSCLILNERESDVIRGDIHKKYPAVYLGSPIDFYSGVGIQDDQPWMLLPKLLRDFPVYVIFPHNREKRIARIENGQMLGKIIDDMGYLFEYIITDETMSFLLGEHHAGILMGAGKAEEWIRSLRQGQESP
jgi:hypothetical protein